jgi:hypothetical protein
LDRHLYTYIAQLVEIDSEVTPTSYNSAMEVETI